MELIEAIKTRKSIRAFKPDPIAKEVIREILEVASRAPSSMNTQPWEFTVIAGSVLENIRQGNVAKFNSRTPPHQEHSVVGWPKESVFRRRQVDLAKQIFNLMDITREDKAKRYQWLERGFRFFDAPAAIVICTDRMLSEAGPLIDIGAITQNICLAALPYGLGTCIEDQGVAYPEVIRKFVPIEESKRIITSIAIGYPNWEFPANCLISTRESIDTITCWYGFE